MRECTRTFTQQISCQAHAGPGAHKAKGGAHFAVFLGPVVRKGSQALIKSSHKRAIAHGDGLWEGAQGASRGRGAAHRKDYAVFRPSSRHLPERLGGPCRPCDATRHSRTMSPSRKDASPPPKPSRSMPNTEGRASGRGPTLQERRRHVFFGSHSTNPETPSETSELAPEINKCKERKKREEKPVD